MKRLNALGLMAFSFAWGCHIQAPIDTALDPILTTAQVNEQETPMMNQSDSINFVSGSPIEPAENLLRWLNEESLTADGQRRLLRLPVVVYFEDSYRLALGESFIGTSASKRDNSLFLSLDDTSMGISLLSTLQDLCPESDSYCAVWLEGYWGSLINLDSLDFPGLPDSVQSQKEGSLKKSPFSVLRVHGRVQEQSNNNEAVTVFIEALP